MFCMGKFDCLLGKLALYVPYDYDDDDNETDDENDDDGDDAKGHLHAGNGGAAHGNIISGTLYRQQFTDTHFW